MRTRLTATAVATGAICLGVAFAAPAGAAPAAADRTATPAHACSQAVHPGYAACLALVRTDVKEPHGVGPSILPSGYGPADLLSAYKLPANGGAGTTIAIVDAYDNPNAAANLATYRSTYGLPALTAGQFTKYNQTGGLSPLPAADSGWGLEEALDLDMVSAVAPKANIILVEASSPSYVNLGTAVNTAVAKGAKYVSNSYGGGESAGETSYDTYYNHPGVAITVSSGDSGYGVEYPAASRYVTAVGGTTLNHASNARGWSESAWSGAGSGESAYEAKPAWQNSTTGTTRRAVADVSAVADPATGLAVYDTYGYSGWYVVGGTSASSPIIASVYALAGAPTAGSYPASYPWAHPGNLFDITTGSNGSSPSNPKLTHAGVGWDGPTGLGTPNGTAAFHA